MTAPITPSSSTGPDEASGPAAGRCAVSSRSADWWREKHWNAHHHAHQMFLETVRLNAEIERLQKFEARMKWLHDCSTGCKDAEGFEWGIYRVKWENGQAVQVWQTNSDFSDLDAEMARDAASANSRG